MRFEHCENCQQRVGFGRRFGWGTFFAVLVTFGLWLITLPFYPLRCIRCGWQLQQKVSIGGFDPGRVVKMVAWGSLVLLALMVIGLLSQESTSTVRTDQPDSSAVAGSSGPSPEEVYIRDNIELYEFEAKYMASVLDGRIPGVAFKLRNKGDRTLDRVKVVVFFKDAPGAVIAEEEYLPVLVSEWNSSSDNKPLKPGYIWQMERGKFYAAKSVPTEWKGGAAEAKVTEIRFASASDAK